MRRLISPSQVPAHTRHYLTHGDLIKSMQNYGYPGAFGVCHGIACLAAYHSVFRTQKNFYSLLKKVSTLSESDKLKDPRITGLFDRIQFSQNPNSFRIFHPSNYNTGKIDQSLTFIFNCLAAEDRKSIFRSNAFSCVYSQEELENYFSILSKVSQYFSHPFALVLSSISHSIEVHYDPSTLKWTVTDVENLPYRTFDVTEIAVFAKNVFRFISTTDDNTTIAMSSYAITDAKYKETATRFWSAISKNTTWKAIHCVKDKARKLDAQGVSWLSIAAAYFLTKEARALILAGANVNHTNPGLSTPLAISCQKESVSIAYLLLQNGAHPNLGSPKPLNNAVEQGNIQLAAMLLAYGANPNLTEEISDNTSEMHENAPRNKTTLLHTAVRNGDFPMVQLLLSYRANPNIGFPSPLFSAAENGNAEIAAELKRAGAKAGSHLFFRKPKFLSEKRDHKPSAGCGIK